MTQEGAVVHGVAATSQAKLEGVDHHLIGLGDGFQGTTGMAVLTARAATARSSGAFRRGLGVAVRRRRLGGIRGVLLQTASQLSNEVFQILYFSAKSFDFGLQLPNKWGALRTVCGRCC